MPPLPAPEIGGVSAAPGASPPETRTTRRGLFGIPTPGGSVPPNPSSNHGQRGGTRLALAVVVGEFSINERVPAERAVTSPDAPTVSRLPLRLGPPAGAGGEVRTRGGRFARRAIYLPLLLGLVFAGGVGGLYFQPPGVKKFFALTGLAPGGGTRDPIAVALPSAASDADEAIGSAHDVVGLGTLVPNGDVVTLAVPSGAGDARIESIEVEIGQRVEKGQIVAVLDNLDDRKRTVIAAEASVAVYEASLQQIKGSVSSSRAETRALVRQLSTAAAEAKSDLERTEALFDGGLATAQELERARSRAHQARLQVDGAKATLSRYGKRGVGSQADVLVASRNLESARAELERAQQDLGKAHVRAPMIGVVLDIHARPGERPGASGVMSLANIDEMTVEVEVFQAQIGQVSVGDPVEIAADALSTRLHGAVARIGLEVGRQTIIDGDPAANTDARVVTVVVALDPESSAIARSYTSLQVVARFRAQQGDAK
ncbi:MAG: HlyD family efflux transporter periplasmic adaptor subunit [Nannocystaceae bacterium]